MATEVGQKQISQPQLNLSTPITPIRYRNGGHISHTSRVIANFLLKFSFFSLPWQQGFVWHKFYLHS